jgi:ABC-type enterochelin transport system permease subunit
MLHGRCCVLKEGDVVLLTVGNVPFLTVKDVVLLTVGKVPFLTV